MKELLHEVIHKVRTPTVSIVMGASIIKEFLPLLIDGYKKAQKNKLNITEISEEDLEYLKKVMNNIEIEANFINHYLDELTQRSRENV